MATIHSLPTETLLDIFSSLPATRGSRAESPPTLRALAATCTAFAPLAQVLLNHHVTLSHLSSAQQWLGSEVGAGVSRSLAIEEDPVGALGEGWQERWVERCVEKTGGRLTALRLGKLRCELDSSLLEMDELANLTSLSIQTALGEEDDTPSIAFSLKHLAIDATSVSPALFSALLASSSALSSLAISHIFTQTQTPSSAGRRASSPFEEKSDPFWALDAAEPCLAGLRELTLSDAEPKRGKLEDEQVAGFLRKCTTLKRISTHVLPQETMQALSKTVEEIRVLPTEGCNAVWELKREWFPRLRRVTWAGRTAEAMAEDEGGACFLARCGELGIEVSFEEVELDVFGDAILDRE